VEIPADAISREVRALLDELIRRGYVVGEERDDEDSFGNALVVLERSGTAVGVVRDRGQWFVEVADAGRGEWFAPVVWHAFLESSMPRWRPRPSTLRLDCCSMISDGPRR
jgi:hypothetical protein